MIGRTIFDVAHHIAFPGLNEAYAYVIKNHCRSRTDLQKRQIRGLRTSLVYAYESVPYYHRVFREHNIKPDDIKTIPDLQKLPILTKEDIRSNWEDLKPIGLEHIKFSQRATGGTTGTPLTYRISSRDRMMSIALLYRGWGYAGYRPGDKMVYLAGSSLGAERGVHWLPNVRELARNARMLSSFDMNETRYRGYIGLVNSFRPRFIRGYPSALDAFSKWISERKLNVHRPEAVFVTSEKLHPKARTNIESAFDCEVFDHYGLNDGGVSAFECPEHAGLHIDTERSLMEVVDEFGNRLEEGEGRILATSTCNEAMPFIRYDTGDDAALSADTCRCGRGSRLLDEIVGRATDLLYTPDGRVVHGWFFLYLFWELSKGIRQYQVIQENPVQIVINIVPDDDFSNTTLDDIRMRALEKCAAWNIEFRIVDKIPLLNDGKTKFIVSMIEGNRI